MFLYRRSALVLLSLFTASAYAEGFVLAAGLEGDSADGRAISAFGDFSIGENTWMSLSAMAARTEGIFRDNEIVFADIGIDHSFDPIGIRIGASYWGDADILDSRDLLASLYISGETGSISAEFERRNFEFDLQSDLLRGRTAKFSANGLGLRARLKLSEHLGFSLNGMTYDYSRNIRLQPEIDTLVFLSSSRLSMINSLIDYRFNAGLEFKFGLRSIDVKVGRWQTAIDGGNVDSYSLGFLTPVSDRLDVEFRIAFDDSDTFGRTTALSVYLYYFGGS